MRAILASALLVGSSPPPSEAQAGSEDDSHAFVEAMKPVFNYRSCIQGAAVVRAYCTGDQSRASFDHAVRKCSPERALFVENWSNFLQYDPDPTDDPDLSQLSGEDAAGRLEVWLFRDYAQRIDQQIALAKAPPQPMSKSVCKDINAQNQ